MARPIKKTIDYFPHYCNHKKTMYILESKFGNDGYAFWFKLLEILGSTENHSLYYDNVNDWEFLQAKTHLSSEQCENILNLLATIGAIDKKLWGSRIVWSQNFIDGIADVYKNRRVEIPKKPSIYKHKPKQCDVSTDTNRQSKVKESKVKESKVKESKGGFTERRKPDYSKKEKNIFYNPSLKTLNNITDQDKKLWKESYPACNIDIELKRMCIWLDANPTKRKSNYKQFINNWLNRSQNFGGTRGATNAKLSGGGANQGSDTKYPEGEIYDNTKK